MLDSRLEAFSDLAENRERSIRDKLRLVKSDIFDQDETSLSPPPQEHRSSTVPERSQQLTTAQLATHEREHPAREAMQGAFYDTTYNVRGSASGDPWTAPQGAFAYEDPWRRPKAPIELNVIKKPIL